MAISRNTFIENGRFGIYEKTYLTKKTSLDLKYFLNEDFFIRYLNASNKQPFLLDYGPISETPGLLSRSITPWKKTLREHIKAATGSSDSLRAKDIFYSLVKALKFLHEENVVHPDLSPSTIVISNENTVQIRDFDRAHFAETFHQSPLKPIEFPYTSPEILLNLHRSTSTPLWNLALIVGEMFTKRVLCNVNSNARAIQSHLQLTGKTYPEPFKEIWTSDEIQWEPHFEESQNLSQVLKSASQEQVEDLLDLLYKMLEYRKENRPSFQEILRHPYFNDVVLNEDLLKQKKKIDFYSMEIKNHLGGGTFGDVFEICLPNNSKKYVVKISKKQKDRDQQEHRESILKEDTFLRFMSKFPNSSSFIVKRFSVLNFLDERIGIVFERMEMDLYKYISLQKNCLPLKKIKKLTLDLINGLQFLASLRIIHFDLKPQNILMSKDGTLKIIDFGSSCFSDKLHQPSSFYKQSRWYRSPEAILDIGINLSTDIWSLGAVSTEIVYRQAPFPGNSEKELLAFHEFRLKKPYPQSLLKQGSPKKLEALSRVKLKPLVMQRSLEQILRDSLRNQDPQITEQLIGLIERTFEYDYTKRPTANDLLNDPFIQTEANTSLSSPQKKARTK